MSHFDLTIPEHAYLFGFLQTDGSLSANTRNRGKVTLEIAYRDKHILEAFQELVPENSSIRERTRDTNFKKGYHSAVWTLCDWELRTTLNALGLPYGKKSDVVSPPKGEFSERDYYRGIIDGDGSLGMTKTGRVFPFVSFGTKSPALASGYKDFVFRVLGKTFSNNPNTRDRMYNLMVTREDAQVLAAYLYPEGCLALERKVEAARKISEWVRPPDMGKITWERRKWLPEEDEFVLTRAIQESVEVLRRTERSVKMRIWRLAKKKGIQPSHVPEVRRE